MTWTADRVFYPNLGQYRVEMIDNNNYIGSFGHYGNADSIGGGKTSEFACKYESSGRSHPDIPLARPTCVAVFGYVRVCTPHAQQPRSGRAS